MNHSTKVPVLVVLVLYVFTVKADSSSGNQREKLSKLFHYYKTPVMGASLGAIGVAITEKLISRDADIVDVVAGAVMGLLMGLYYEMRAMDERNRALKELNLAESQKLRAIYQKQFVLEKRNRVESQKLRAALKRYEELRKRN